LPIKLILFSNSEDRIDQVQAALAKSLNCGDIEQIFTKPGEFPRKNFPEIFISNSRPRLSWPRRLDFRYTNGSQKMKRTDDLEPDSDNPSRLRRAHTCSA
jgi:hypothetical protein